MASSIRHSSTMLHRMAMQRPSPARCFTTTAMNLNERRAPKPPPRINPLIGGMRAKPLEPVAQEPAAPARPNINVQSTMTPPPPPPPPKSASAAATSLPPPPPPSSSSDTTSTAHTYSATSKGVPFQLDVTGILSSKASDYGRSVQQDDPLTRPRVRAVAATGRTIFVRNANPGPNSAPTVRSALAMLGRLVGSQHVKNKYYSQRFHERKGLKRKRLASERWRSRFKVGFCAAYTRVHELRKQGW
ncbi:hypothetical protein BB8028_0001g09950 [Beauveria bassiana]|uniref:Ribosomal protein S21 n=2 Tax=Beauveria bassiana TaxID=176275 RepID=A0A2S7XZ20_BEABA|nr:hypothetical protein BB8028_0001g09950 [Beauveria bassiana]